MKKLIWVLLVLLFITGCDLTTQALGSGNIAEYIQPPPARAPKITGTWELADSQFLGEGEVPATEEPGDTSRYILLTRDFVAAFRQYTTKPALRSKVVNATSYTIQKLRKTPDSVGIAEDDLEIVTVEGSEQFILEILVTGPDQILVARDGFLHTFHRVSDELNHDIYAKFMEEEDSEDVDQLRPGVNTDTTLLLGRRSVATGDVNVPAYRYETILLHMPANEGEVEVYAVTDLYAPRSSGFWKIAVAREEVEDRITETVTAAPYMPGASTENSGAVVMQDPVGRGLTFVNSNYISMESTYYLETLYSQYETYTYDTLGDRQSLDITLVAGEKGKETLLSAGEAEAQQLRNENGSRIVRPPETDEWGISRRNGRWIFRAMIRAMDGNTSLRKGFDLNILPTTRMFSHNELSIPWRTIREKHPPAVDALTSPNQDYVLIQERFTLYVYRLRNGVMDEVPVKRIRMRQNDRMVMAEWASGNAANEWKNTFLTIPQLEITE